MFFDIINEMIIIIGSIFLCIYFLWITMFDGIDILNKLIDVKFNLCNNFLHFLVVVIGLPFILLIIIAVVIIVIIFLGMIIYKYLLTPFLILITLYVLRFIICKIKKNFKCFY